MGLTAASWQALVGRNWALAQARSPQLPPPAEFVPTGNHQGDPAAAYAADPSLHVTLSSALGPVVLARVAPALSGDRLVEAIAQCSGPPLPPGSVLDLIDRCVTLDPVTATQAAAAMEEQFRGLAGDLPVDVRDALGLPVALGRCLDIYAAAVYDTPVQLRSVSAASTPLTLSPFEAFPDPGVVSIRGVPQTLLGTLSGYLALGAVAAATRLAAALASAGINEPVVRSTLTWAVAFPSKARVEPEEVLLVQRLIDSLPSGSK